MRLIFFFILIFYNLWAFTQSRLNDIEVRQKAYFFKFIDTDSVIFYAKKLQQSSDYCNKISGLVIEADAHYDKKDFLKSEKMCNQILELVKDNYDLCILQLHIKTVGRLFWIKKNQNKFGEAYQLLLIREKLGEYFDKNSLDYFLNISRIKSDMALIKSSLGLYDDAIIILKKNIFELKKNTPNVSEPILKDFMILRSGYLNIIADSYLHLGQLDSARTYYKKAYTITQQFNPPHEDSEPLYHFRLARVLIKEGKYNEALDMVNKYSYKSETLTTTQDINFLKALIFHNVSENDSAKVYSYRFLEYPKTTPSTQKNKIVVYNILAEVYDNYTQTDSAYTYSRLATEELEKLNASTHAANRYHYLYDFKKVNELNQSLIKKETEKRTRLIVLFTGTVLIVVLFVFFLYKRGKKVYGQYLATVEDYGKKWMSPKKEYSIDARLEDKVMSGLETMEASRRFLDDNFNIYILAKELQTNTSYLSAIINQKKKRPFKQYIAELRINHLTELLKKETKFRKYTVKALAEEVGYTNPTSFARAFKKQTGKTPSEYISTLK